VGFGKLTLDCNRPARHFPLFPFFGRNVIMGGTLFVGKEFLKAGS
jgi:hypothetical protein